MLHPSLSPRSQLLNGHNCQCPSPRNSSDDRHFRCGRRLFPLHLHAGGGHGGRVSVVSVFPAIPEPQLFEGLVMHLHHNWPDVFDVGRLPRVGNLNGTRPVAVAEGDLDGHGHAVEPRQRRILHLAIELRVVVAVGLQRHLMIVVHVLANAARVLAQLIFERGAHVLPRALPAVLKDGRFLASWISIFQLG